MDIIDHGSLSGQIQSFLDEILTETIDLPAERKERVAGALQKIRSCCSALVTRPGDGSYSAQLQQANATLAASEAKYRALAESITDPFVAYDANLRLLYRNKAAAEATQIPDEQALGKTFSELYPNLVGTEAHQRYLLALETHQPQKYLTHWVRPTDGKEFYFDLSIYPTSNGLIAFSRDVSDRIRAEVAQREALQQAAWMSRFPDENPNPVARVSTDGKILYCNRASAEISGWAFVCGEGLPVPLLSFLEEVKMLGTQVERDVQLGERIYAITFMPFPKDHYVNLYGRDITERKQAEAALEKTYHDLINEQNRLLAVMEALPAGIAILDQKGAVIQINQGYKAVWGSPLPPPASSVADYQAYQAWWVETGQPVQPEEWASAQAVQKGETITGQFLQIQRFDGKRAYVLNSGAPTRNAKGAITGSVVAVMDVTPLIEAENALRESQARFRVALKAAPLLVYTCDLEQRYTWVYNPLRGFREEDVLGKRDDEVLPAEAAAELIAAKQLALETGQGGVQEVKVPFNGTYTYYLLTTDPIRDPQGRVTGLTCSAIDISDQKHLEEEQREQAIQIEVQRRLMDQREQDRYAIARDLHDGPIQTLSSTTFHLHMVKEVFPDPALKVELDQIGRDIRNTIQELRTVMNDLRPPALMHFGFSKVLQLYAEDFRARFPDIEFEVDGIEDDMVLSNEAHLTLFRIYQAGINNIIRHAGASKISVIFKIDQGSFFLELRDNGSGFELKKDFHQLAQTGHFGLVGMKERAEAIGGEFSVFSQPGQGTRIVVRGPLSGKNLK